MNQFHYKENMMKNHHKMIYFCQPFRALQRAIQIKCSMYQIILFFFFFVFKYLITLEDKFIYRLNDKHIVV
jgi:hypothetical protein